MGVALKQKKKSQIKGGEVITRILAAEGVDQVFGIVDGSYFGLCEGLRQAGIRLVSPRHETTAIHMAGAYARTSGRLGVCLASNGPGVANVLSGQMTAEEAVKDAHAKMVQIFQDFGAAGE